MSEDLTKKQLSASPNEEGEPREGNIWSHDCAHSTKALFSSNSIIPYKKSQLLLKLFYIINLW